MKKTVVLISFILILLLIMGCNSKKKTTEGVKEKKELYIYNWTYYIPPEVLKGFEEKYNCKIIYDEFTSNEEMFAKLKGMTNSYDITFPSGDFTSIMIKEGMILEIDKTKVPNFKNISPDILEAIKFDTENKYSIPYAMAATGVAVNTKYIKDFPKDMSIFEKLEYKRKTLLLDDKREVIGHALAHLGYSVNSTNPDELEKAKTLVLSWKKNILGFDAESNAKKFATEKVWITQSYAENVWRELSEEQKQNFEFYLPEKGGPKYIDSMVILKDAPNKELAYQFMNYILEPQVYAKVIEFFRFPSIIPEAMKYTTVKPFYELKDIIKFEFKEDVGSSIEIYNRVWQEIKMEK
jgi:spermidine/putrescine transport system substrate-binding protein